MCSDWVETRFHGVAHVLAFWLKARWNYHFCLSLIILSVCINQSGGDSLSWTRFRCCRLRWPDIDGLEHTRYTNAFLIILFCFFSSILTNQKDTTIKVTNTMHVTIWKQTEKNIGYTQSFSGILIIIICIQNFVVTFILKLCAESESDQLTSDHILHDCVCVDAYMMEYLVYSIRYCLRLR